jgi:hypothetical protein
MRSFYFDKKDERVVFGDIREKETHLLTNGQTIHIEPDEVMDFRNIPYPDESFQMVIFCIHPIYSTYLRSLGYVRSMGYWTSRRGKKISLKGFSECFQSPEA